MSSASDRDGRAAWRALHSASLWRVPYGDLASIPWRHQGEGKRRRWFLPTIADATVGHMRVQGVESDIRSEGSRALKKQVNEQVM